MKKIVLLWVCLLGLASTQAQLVTMEQAKEVAKQLLTAKGVAIDNPVLECRLQTKLEKPLYWLVRFKSGWVLVACNQQANPIIAYNSKGSFIDSLPILQTLAQAMPQNSSPTEAAHQWKVFEQGRYAAKRSGVLPLISTQWGQNTPFNNLCPVDALSKSGHALTGCGATAMAQLMNYHQWPTTGVGSNSYLPGLNQHYGIQSVDFAAAQYNYQAMTDADKAKLSYHAGVSVNMEYGPKGSSSKITDVVRALKANFKYLPTIDLLDRRLFTTDKWKAIIKAELDAKRPIFYASDDSIKNFGHAFIIDGYDDAGLFHCNWGWNGSSDGYYDINSLKPDTLDFNANDMMAIGIAPPTTNLSYKPDFKFVQSILNFDTVVINHTMRSDLVPNSLSSSDLLFYHFSVSNSGNVDITNTISMDIYIDDILVAQATTDVLRSSWPLWLQDGSMNIVSAGTHTLKMVIDPKNVYDEQNEQNNVYIKTFVINQVAPKPNLLFLTTANKPTGLSMSKTREGQSTTNFAQNDSIFISAKLTNLGAVHLRQAYTLKLLLDGAVVETKTIDSTLQYQTIAVLFALKATTVGTQKVQVIIDNNNTIVETNETDNSYEQSFTVTSSANLPNIAFYLEAQWSGPVVVADTTETYLHQQAISPNKPLYIDFSFTNNGNSDILEPVNYMIEVDGKDVIYVTTPSLAKGSKLYFRDLKLNNLTDGLHTIAVRLDYDDAIAEQNENDNRQAVTVKVGIFSDLTSITNAFNTAMPLVISKTRNVIAQENNFIPSDSLFVHTQIRNTSGVAISSPFEIQLLIDNVVTDRIQIANLAANTQINITNLKAGKLLQGTHTAKILIDSQNAVFETNEYNNKDSASIYVWATKPSVDLAFYNPYTDSLSIDAVRLTNNSTKSFKLGDTLFVDYYPSNQGSSDVLIPFSTVLSVDDSIVSSKTFKKLSSLNYYEIFDDNTIRNLKVGTHRITIAVDPQNTIDETNEKNNSITRRIMVYDTAANLSASSLQISDMATKYNAALLFVSDSTLYVQFSFENTRLMNINSSFTASLTLDNVTIQNYTFTSIAAMSNIVKSGIAIGKLSVGQHSILLRINNGLSIYESNIADNDMVVHFTVIAGGTAPTIPSKPTGDAQTCIGKTSTYHTNSVANANNYLWTLWPTNAGQLSNNGTEATIAWNGTFSGKAWIKVAAQNNIGTSLYGDSLEISFYAKPAAPIIKSNKTALCPNESATITAEASTGSSYKWSDGSTSVSISVQTANTYKLETTDASGCYTQTSNTITISALSAPAVPSISANPSLSLCGDETTTLSTSSYANYKWSNNATSPEITVSAGSYSVIVYDNNGCQAQSATVVVVSNPLPNKPVIVVSENDLSISTTAANVAWYNAANQLQSSAGTFKPTIDGTYFVKIITDKACFSTSDAVNFKVKTPTVPAAPSKPTGTTNVCAGETKNYTSELVANATNYIWSIWPSTAGQLFVNGIGTSVQWSATFTGKAWLKLAAQNNVGQSTFSDSLEINIAALPSPSIVANPTSPQCGTLTTAISLNKDYSSYLWSNNETSKQITVTTGEYSVTVYEGTCSNKVSISVANKEVPQKPIILVNKTSLSITRAAASFQWYNAANELQSTSGTFTPNKDGDYYVLLTADNGCSAKSDVVTFHKTDANELSQSNISLRYNTDDQTINIVASDEMIEQVLLFTNNGQLLQNQHPQASSCKIHIATSQCLIITIKTSSGWYSQKLLMQ